MARFDYLKLNSFQMHSTLRLAKDQTGHPEFVSEDGIDLLSTSFADDFTKLLHKSSAKHQKKHQSLSTGKNGDTRASATSLTRSQVKPQVMGEALKRQRQNLSRGKKGGKRSESLGDLVEDLEGEEYTQKNSRTPDGALGQATGEAKGQQALTSGRRINMDISMNEIKEVDEGQLSDRRLRKRFRALQQSRKHKERAAKLKKAQSAAVKRRQSRPSRHEEQQYGVNVMSMDSMSDSRNRNPSIASFNNRGSPARGDPGQQLMYQQTFYDENDPSDVQQVMSSSFNPRRGNNEVAQQLLAGAARIRRFDTGYARRGKPRGTLLGSHQPALNKVGSVPDEFLMRNSMKQQPSDQQTPFWNQNDSASHSKKADLTRESPQAPTAFEQIQEVDDSTTFLRDGPNTATEMVLSHDLSVLDQTDDQLDMFSVDNQQLILTAEETQQVNYLKSVRQGQQIDHQQLVQAPFSPMSLPSQQFNSTMAPPHGMHRQFQTQGGAGRWLLPSGSQGQKQLQSSSSELMIECAREKRLKHGFQRRILLEKNQDLLGQDNGSALDTTEDRNFLESQLIKQNKLQGVVLQMPPQTVFDFKDQLRRPASAKITQSRQMQRSLKAFQKLQKMRKLEEAEEREMQQRKEEQIKELYLDHYSWDMPYKMSTAGLNPSRAEKAGAAGDGSASDIGGASTGKDGKKDGKKVKKTDKTKKTTKVKKEKEDVPLTREQQRAFLLQKIADERREKEISNLWPEPESKIFLGSRPTQAKKSSQQRRRRNIPSSARAFMGGQGLAQSASGLLSNGKKFNDNLRLKLEQLGGVPSISPPARGHSPNLQLNSDLIIETKSSHSSEYDSDKRARVAAGKDLKPNDKKLAKQKSSSSAAAQAKAKKGGSSLAKLNADLPMMQKNQSAAVIRKSKFAPDDSATKDTKDNRARTLRRVGSSFHQAQEAKKEALQVMQKKLTYLREVSVRRTSAAIAAIARKSTTRSSVAMSSAHLYCKKHTTYNCICMRVEDTKQNLDMVKKQLFPVKKRVPIFQRATVPSKSANFKRAWEVKGGSDNTMIKQDKMLYMREPPKPLWKDIEENYDDQMAEQIFKKRLVKLYDVQDIQRELEELTEDEEEIKQTTNDSQDVWKIKRLIKMSLKRYFVPPKTTLEMYKIGRVLGKGAYGKVNIALQRLTSKICAVKSINLAKVNSDEAIMKITNEKEILRTVRHSSIVKLYEAIREDHMGYELLFMELCAGGDLLGYLRRRRRLDESLAKLFMQQLFQALGYLHQKGIAHRDLKLENILLSNLGRIKICDFGVSTCCKSTDTGKDIPMTDCCGTPAYMAPEVIQTGEQRRLLAAQIKEGVKKKNRLQIEGYGPKCDLWSAGVLLYALVYGNMPFRGVTVREIKEKVLSGKYLLKDSVSKEVQDLIKGMLQLKPEDRLSVEQILQHEWFADVPEQESQTIFNAQERASMMKEYFFTEDPEKWDCYVDMHQAELRDFLKWTESNLRTIDSTELADLKNVSEGSQILAPNNSSQDDDRTLFDDLPPDVKEEIKLEQIAFSPQAFRADIQYEQEHNQHCDNGVYTDKADIEELANRAGLKEKSQVAYKTMLMQRQKQQAALDATEIQRRATISKYGQSMPVDWEKIDEAVNWELEPFKEENNPYSEPIVIRCDIVFKVSRFGYAKEHIIDSIVNNKDTHQHAAYQILTEDHENIL